MAATWLHALAMAVHFTQGTMGETLIRTGVAPSIEVPLKNGDREWGRYSVQELTPVFSWLSVLNHAWAVFRRRDYEHYVAQGYNPARWLEFAFSAGLMWHMVAALSGIHDLKLHLELILGNFLLQFIGYLSEREPQVVSLHVLGFGLFVMLLTPIWIAFITNILDSNAPAFVWVIIILITLFFLSFGILNVLRRKLTFKQIEIGYIVLSLTSKLFLANMTLFASGGGEVSTS